MFDDEKYQQEKYYRDSLEKLSTISTTLFHSLSSLNNWISRSTKTLVEALDKNSENQRLLAISWLIVSLVWFIATIVFWTMPFRNK